jgi:Mg-chelatase subunit ChlD
MATVVALAAMRGAATRAAAPAELPDFDAACAAGQAWLVTSCFITDYRRADVRPSIPSVLMFTDTPANKPQYLLASATETGPVYGLAFSRSELAVYAAAFRKRSFPLGPGGLGAIYRLDIAADNWRVFVTVPNVGMAPQAISDIDGSAQREATKTGLGDIDLNGDETELFAVNLYDRRIYRYAVPSGDLLGSFPNGAAAEDWSDKARPFGLSVHDGRVYHGVVNSAEGGSAQDLRAVIYSSAPDGTDMRADVSFALDYARGRTDVPRQTCPSNPCFPASLDIRWRPWLDRALNREEEAELVVYPMPIVGDIVFDGSGNMTIGLRDRLGDIALPQLAGRFGLGQEVSGLAIGDIVLAERGPSDWMVDIDHEHYDDQFAHSADGMLGALAYLWQPGKVVATSLGDYPYFPYPVWPYEGITWLDPVSGNKVGFESVCEPKFRGSELPRMNSVHPEQQPESARPSHNEGVSPAALGDLEAMCGPPLMPTQTSTATATMTSTSTATPSATATEKASPSATATTTPTATAIPSPTATSTPQPLLLPLLLKEDCSPGTQRTDVVLVIDASSSMLEPTATGRTKLAVATDAARVFLDQLHFADGDQAAVVSFNAEATLLAALSPDRATLDAALAGITTAQFTRIDRGIAVAAGELASARHRVANAPVMIVLTDGRANPVPVSVAEAEARAAKDAGAVLFTIGLGSDLDTEALRGMASKPEYLYVAPDAEALAGIYRGIAVAIPCPAGTFWGRR